MSRRFRFKYIPLHVDAGEKEFSIEGFDFTKMTRFASHKVVTLA